MSTPTSAPAAESTADGMPAQVPSHLGRIGVTPSLREYLVQLWQQREFVATVSTGELRAQNQNTVLGNLWHLLNPLLLAGVYYLVFGVILGARGGIDYYPAFLIIGIMTYQYAGKVMQAGARTVVSNLKLIQSVRFPRATLPLASTLSETQAHIPALGVMMVLVVGTSPFADDPSLPVLLPRPSWLLVIPAMALLVLFGMGLALVTARLTFHFRDVEHLLPYLLRLWMYLSGMFFPVSFVEERVGEGSVLVTLFKANPLWEFFTMFRGALMGDAVTGGPFDPAVWLAAAAWSVALCLLGFQYFRANEAEYSRA